MIRRRTTFLTCEAVTCGHVVGTHVLDIWAHRVYQKGRREVEGLVESLRADQAPDDKILEARLIPIPHADMIPQFP